MRLCRQRPGGRKPCRKACTNFVVVGGGRRLKVGGVSSTPPVCLKLPSGLGGRTDTWGWKRRLAVFL